VYIPTGTKEADTEGNEAGANVRSAVANRLSMVRRRFVNAGHNADLDNSQHSKDSLDSTEILDDEEEAEVATASLNVLSKNERNVFKKIVADFPNGKVCALSMSSMEKQDKESVSSTGFAVKTQEWNSFNRMLGAVIVNGFKDRCRRYQDELRRMDAQRASEATAAKIGIPKSPKNLSNAFSLSYFFLVKESFAFTYEQMQLPSEALLQYDEFRAFLPDLSDKDYLKAKEMRKDCHALMVAASPSLVELADAGEFFHFRQEIRSVSNVDPILDIFRRYLFARELCLLTKMEQPAELVSRCRKFIKFMYTLMMRGLSEMSLREQKRRKGKAAEWVIQFSWDVKCASEQYLISMAESARAVGDTESTTTMGSRLSESSDATEAEKALSRQLCELLEIARLFYKELGDAKFADKNPLRNHEKLLPADMFKSWPSWEPAELKPAVEDGPASEPPRRVSIMNNASLPNINLVEEKRIFLLSDAFFSEEKFEDTYLVLASALVTLNRFADRKRCAARLQGEIAESFVRSGHLMEAAEAFKKIVKICRFDHWDRCHFYRLFRLAYCQRTTVKPSEYLKTLVSAFSPRTTAVAPAKALNILQDDLEAVIGHESVGEARYGKLAFLETQLRILETSSEATNMGNSFDGKELVKKYCSVGESVQIKVLLNSNLPRAIELSSFKLFIVSFDTFSTIIENRESVEEEDTFKILSLDSPFKLEPGVNTYTFDWAPLSTGLYILSTAEIVWRQGFFYYDSMDLPKALHGVDVLPSDPTHSISIDPEYLLPRHDQEVRITFHARKDFIMAGELLLSCSEGLTLLPPGDDPTSGNWQDSCILDLGTYKPGETKLFTAHVRCGFIENFSAHGFSVSASTTYLREESEDADHPMRNKLKAFAPILEKTALSVESVDLIWILPGEKALITVDVDSNTPRHFSVEGWELFLPPPLHIIDGVDLNGDLLNCQVRDGDHLSFAFECSVNEENEDIASDESILKVNLCDDLGKKFSLEFFIDLDAHYLKLLEGSHPKSPISVTTSLLIDSSHGDVGEPVVMTFNVEAGELASLEIISYSIASEGSDWLVGGQVNGILDKSSLSCDVIGIPKVAGRLSNFPKLILRHEPKSGDTITLLTKFHQPPAFDSRAWTSEVAVAFPSL
jgi:hypothetical protein